MNIPTLFDEFGKLHNCATWYDWWLHLTARKWFGVKFSSFQYSPSTPSPSTGRTCACIDGHLGRIEFLLNRSVSRFSYSPSHALVILDAKVPTTEAYRQLDVAIKMLTNEQRKKQFDIPPGNDEIFQTDQNLFGVAVGDHGSYPLGTRFHHCAPKTKNNSIIQERTLLSKLKFQYLPRSL